MKPIVFLEISDTEWAEAEEDKKASVSSVDEPDISGRDAQIQSRSGSSPPGEIAETISVKDRKGKGKAVNLDPPAELWNTNAVSALEESSNPWYTIGGDDFARPEFAWAKPQWEPRNTVKVGWKRLMNEREMQRVEFRKLKALERWKKEHGSHDRSTLELMREVAYRYAYREAFKEATDLFEKMHKLAEEAFGSDNPYTLNRLFDLGAAIANQGRFYEAKEVLDQFVRTGKRVLRPEHAFTSMTLDSPESNGKDDLTRLQSCIGEAEGVLQSFSQIRPEYRLKGAQNCLHLSDRETKAHFTQFEDEEGFKDLEIGFGSFPRNFPRGVITVAEIEAQVSVYIEEGRWKKAVQYLLFMLDMHEKVLGSEHTDTLAIMSRLAALYDTHQQLREAEAQYSRLVELKRRTLGERDPETLVAAFMHGRMISKQGLRRLEDVARVIPEAARKAQPVLESFERLNAMEEVQKFVKDPTWNQESDPNPRATSELMNIWAKHQRHVVAADTNESPSKVNQPEQVTPQRDQGGAENPSETKRLEALEKALKAEGEAELGRPDHARRFGDLSLEHESAYQRTRRIEYLDGAIRNAEQAIKIAPKEAPGDLASMTNLVKWYKLKFERTGKEDELKRASKWAEQAVQCASEINPELATGIIFSLFRE